MVSMADAAGYLARHKEFSCSCKICGGRPLSIRMPENDVRKHFLYSRKKENIDIESKELNEILTELEDSLKIPDRELVPFGLRKTHLVNWIDVVS